MSYDLRRSNASRQKEWDLKAQITTAYRGNELAGEVGEACNVIKKLERERLGIVGSRATVSDLAEELSDVVICGDLIAMHLGIPSVFRGPGDKYHSRRDLSTLGNNLGIGAFKVCLALSQLDEGDGDGAVEAALRDLDDCVHEAAAAKLINLDTAVALKFNATSAKNNLKTRMHVLYETGEEDAPDVIKDRNGEVVLGLCRLCGRGEVQLEEPCSIDSSLFPSYVVHGTKTFPTMKFDGFTPNPVEEVAKAIYPEVKRLTTPRQIIVGFAGKLNCGKTTAAMHLVNGHGFERLRFGGAIKAMLKCLGLSDAEVDGKLKGTPCELLGGMTPREAMQTLGTEWGRQMVSGTLWLDVVKREAAALDSSNIVIDDVRFPNEARAVKELGGMVIRIIRPEPEALVPRRRFDDHVSEQGDFPVDHVIMNDVPLSMFLERVGRLLFKGMIP